MDFIGHYHWQHENQPILMKEKGHWNERSENNRNATFFDATMSAINTRQRTALALQSNTNLLHSFHFSSVISGLNIHGGPFLMRSNVDIGVIWLHFFSIIDISANIKRFLLNLKWIEVKIGFKEIPTISNFKMLPVGKRSYRTTWHSNLIEIIISYLIENEYFFDAIICHHRIY